MVISHRISRKTKWAIRSEPRTIQLAGGVQRLDGSGLLVSAGGLRYSLCSRESDGWYLKRGHRCIRWRPEVQRSLKRE